MSSSKVPLESASETTADVTRSKLWIDDGNVILQAESTQFRVHKSMLVRHSSVFEDMFSIPQPSEGQPSIEGCPIVHLSDSAKDVKLALGVLYDTYKLYRFSKKALPFPLVAAMLRLGRKYEIDHLWEEAVSRLNDQYPTTSLKHHHDAKRDRIHGYQPIEAVILAWENSVHRTLPILLYLCTTLYTLKELLTGVTLRDGTPLQIPPVLQKIIVVGREEIIKALPRYHFAYLVEDSRVIPSKGCPSRRQCTSACMRLLISIFMHMPALLHCLRPWDDFLATDLCPSCSVAAERSYEAGVKVMWEKLPSFFGLAPWKDLKNCE